MLGRLLLRLAYANVLIALHAAGLSVAALVLAGRSLEPMAVAAPALAMFAVYTFDKVARFDPQDETNDPARSAFIRRFRGSLLLLGELAAIGGAALVRAHGLVALLLFTLPLIAGVVYALPLLPRGAPVRRIKDVTGLKSAYVAAVWVLTTGALPLWLEGGAIDLSAATVLAFAWLFARMLVNTVYFDLGDLDGDRAAGTRTLPVVLGFAATRRLLLACNGAAALLLGAGALTGALPPAAHLINAITLYALVYLGLAREGRDLGFLCDVVVDGEGVVIAALAVLGAALTAAALLA